MYFQYQEKQLNPIIFDEAKKTKKLILKDQGISKIEFYSTVLPFLKDNPDLNELDISRNAIDSTVLIRILQELKLVCLNVNDNMIGEDDIHTIAELIANNKTLKELGLSGCFLGTQSAKALATALSINSTLIALDISANYFSPQDVITFFDGICSNNTLQRLNASNLSISAEAFNKVKEFAAHNESLIELTLKNTGVNEQLLSSSKLKAKVYN